MSKRDGTSPSTRRTRVVIADDMAHVRDGLRRAIELGDGLEAVGEARDGLEAFRLVREARPDVVLMDARMPRMDGLEATRQIKERWPEVRVVILTIHADHRAEADAAGADVFLAKGCPIQELLDALTRPGK